MNPEVEETEWLIVFQVLADVYAFLPLSSRNQDHRQLHAQSRIKILFAQKRASLEYRKNDIAVQFDLLRQRKQAGLRQQRDSYSTDDRNPTPILRGDVVDSRHQCHTSAEPVMYPDSPTIGPSQCKRQQPQDVLGDTTLPDTELTEHYLPTTTYDPTATAIRTVRPVANPDIVKLESNFLQTHFAHPVTGLDAPRGLQGRDPPLHQLQPPKLTLEDRQISLKPSSQEGKLSERDTPDEPSGTAFQNLIDEHLEDWPVNKMSGVRHQEYLRKGNVPMPSTSVEDSKARASVLKTTNNKSNSTLIHRSVTCNPLLLHPTPSVEPPGSPADRASTPAIVVNGSSKPTHNNSLGLDQLPERQSPHVMSKAAVKGYTSRPSLKLDTTFLSNKPTEAEWSDNDSIKATAGSAIADELNANELLVESDCLHMPLLEQSTVHESILAHSQASKIDVDSGFDSCENPLDTTPPPPTNSPELQPQLDANSNKEAKSNLEDDLETLALTSEEENSPSPDIDDQLDGTSWEKIDAKGIEQDDAYFHQVANPPSVGWGEAVRRTAWGWIR